MYKNTYTEYWTPTCVKHLNEKCAKKQVQAAYQAEVKAPLNMFGFRQAFFDNQALVIAVFVSSWAGRFAKQGLLYKLLCGPQISCSRLGFPPGEGTACQGPEAQQGVVALLLQVCLCFSKYVPSLAEIEVSGTCGVTLLSWSSTGLLTGLICPIHQKFTE